MTKEYRKWTHDESRYLTQYGQGAVAVYYEIVSGKQTADQVEAKILITDPITQRYALLAVRYARQWAHKDIGGLRGEWDLVCAADRMELEDGIKVPPLTVAETRTAKEDTCRHGVSYRDSCPACEADDK